jgi:hypothetical protein
MQKVGGAIQWIGDYDDSLACDHRRRQLLTEDDCIRKTAGDDVPITCSDALSTSLTKSECPFVSHASFALIGGVSNDACSAASRLQRDVEQLGIAAQFVKLLATPLARS